MMYINADTFIFEDLITTGILIDFDNDFMTLLLFIFFSIVIHLFNISLSIAIFSSLFCLVSKFTYIKYI